ncbi:WD repeat and coiled-coil-containing protein isoform X2 [Macrotis lagotis]|uniref:WD repeat and coiled-coil-containing protein isoform X2 n=1 Tax=Macrotis lagotis TaxID=92651 RepID=UPI003D69FA93
MTRLDSQGSGGRQRYLTGRMDLGKGKLLRSGLNALYQAIHPIHGIIWTDGKQVVLTALQLQNQEPLFGDSRIIQQFEHVHGLSWGPLGPVGSPTLLAVQHKKHVTVWQLCTSPMEQSKLLVTQTCEIGEPFPVLPQGCVWHPKKAILTVLTSHDVSVLYSVHCDNSRVKADLVKVQGVVHCACWTHDGQRLVVAVGSALHSFVWDDSQKTLQACSFCPVFDVGGHICSVLATVDMQIAVATELPLDKICGLSSTETSEVLIPQERLPPPPPGVDIVEEPIEDTRRTTTDLTLSLPTSPSSWESEDHTQMVPVSYQADSHPLFHLREDWSGTDQDSSHLVLVTFDRIFTNTWKVGIPGILVPDLLAFHPTSQVMAVASNMCHVILIYSLNPSSTTGIQCIRLEACERPKGICFLSDKLLLILVGKQKFTDPTFLPSSKSDKYSIRLAVREVTFASEASLKSTWSQQDFCNIGAPLGMGSKGQLVESHCSIFPQRKELLLSGTLPLQSLPSGKPLIEDITVVSEAQNPRPVPPQPSKPTPTPNSRPSLSKTQCHLIHEPLTLPHDQVIMSKKEESQLCGTLEKLSGKLMDLSQRLSELLVLLQEKPQPLTPTTHPPSQDPDFLLITCQTGPMANKRAVLLCHGKLRLQMVQQMFGLSLVEMQHGSLWILLSADSEGFIPLIFSASEEITIRDGSSNGLGPPIQDGSNNGLGPPIQ